MTTSLTAVPCSSHPPTKCLMRFLYDQSPSSVMLCKKYVAVFGKWWMELYMIIQMRTFSDLSDIVWREWLKALRRTERRAYLHLRHNTKVLLVYLGGGRCIQCFLFVLLGSIGVHFTKSWSKVLWKYRISDSSKSRYHCSVEGDTEDLLIQSLGSSLLPCVGNPSEPNILQRLVSKRWHCLTQANGSQLDTCLLVRTVLHFSRTMMTYVSCPGYPAHCQLVWIRITASCGHLHLERTCTRYSLSLRSI